MSDRTNIEYLDSTWNPIEMQCTPISAGCANCWHLAVRKRFFQNVDSNFFPVMKSRLEQPIHWKKPRRIGVQFMGDIFHENVNRFNIRNVLDVIENCPQHTFFILTKRPERMLYWSKGKELPENCYFGVTVENQKAADERIPLLTQIPGKKWLSVEPLLEPIFWNFPDVSKSIDWVVVGCESGPKRRPCKNAWIHQILCQCKAARIPVFVKQIEINSKVSKNPAEWPEELRVREYGTNNN